MKFFFLLLTTFIILLSCQKIELLEDIVFDNSLLNSININAEKKEIIISYNAAMEKPFMDHVMKISPTKRTVSWVEDNIYNFGTTNKLIIEIVQASVTREEKKNTEKIAGVIKQGNEYHYKIHIMLKFFLYNDEDKILATTNAEVYHTTTSSKFISLDERNHILDQLALESLRNLSKKSIELLKIHMFEYVI